MRKILTLLTLFVITCSGYSQEDDDGGGPNGIRVGYNSANLVNSDDDATANLDKFYVGYFRKMSLAFFKLETGLEYMIAGSKLTSDTELQLHYLVIPAEGVFKLGPFSAMAGVSANIRLAETYKLNGDTIDRPSEEKSNGFDVALNGGLGFSLLMITLETRYYWGLIEVQDGWFNQYWQTGLKFSF